MREGPAWGRGRAPWEAWGAGPGLLGAPVWTLSQRPASHILGQDPLSHPEVDPVRPASRPPRGRGAPALSRTHPPGWGAVVAVSHQETPNVMRSVRSQAPGLRPAAGATRPSWCSIGSPHRILGCWAVSGSSPSRQAMLGSACKPCRAPTACPALWGSPCLGGDSRPGTVRPTPGGQLLATTGISPAREYRAGRARRRRGSQAGTLRPVRGLEFLECRPCGQQGNKAEEVAELAESSHVASVLFLTDPTPARAGPGWWAG